VFAPTDAFVDNFVDKDELGQTKFEAAAYRYERFEPAGLPRLLALLRLLLAGVIVLVLAVLRLPRFLGLMGLLRLLVVVVMIALVLVLRLPRLLGVVVLIGLVLVLKLPLLRLVLRVMVSLDLVVGATILRLLGLPGLVLGPS
jgi:hypothetical protein